MATPNNLTPTNCSWWPISALESDAAKPVEAPDAPEASSPAHWPKESLVLYHWTQSFSSQKVEGAQGADGKLGGDRHEGQVAPASAEGSVLSTAEPSPSSRSISLGLVPSWGHLNRETKAGDRPALPASGLISGTETRKPHIGPAFPPTAVPDTVSSQDTAPRPSVLAGVFFSLGLESLSQPSPFSLAPRRKELIHPLRAAHQICALLLKAQTGSGPLDPFPTC